MPGPAGNRAEDASKAGFFRKDAKNLYSGLELLEE